MSKKNFISIIILVYNEEYYLPKLLKRLVLYTKNYSTEIIFVDSGSSDKSVELIKKCQEKYKKIRLFSIRKESFHFAKTRNLFIRKARGKYILFLSADALPQNKRMFNYILRDFSINERVVAVFCPNIPYKRTPFIQKIEILCWWERINKYVNRNGLLIQQIDKPFIPLLEKTKIIWFMLSNVCTVYKKSFLLKHPFPNVEFAEDISLGKAIIEQNLIKVYDTRWAVLHSHNFNLLQYYQREKVFINFRISKLPLKKSHNFLCKIKKIIELQHHPIKRIYFLFVLLGYYVVKLFIIIQLKYENITRYSHVRQKRDW